MRHYALLNLGRDKNPNRSTQRIDRAALKKLRDALGGGAGHPHPEDQGHEGMTVPGVSAHRVFWVGVALEWVGIVGMLWRWRKGPWS